MAFAKPHADAQNGASGFDARARKLFLEHLALTSNVAASARRLSSDSGWRCALVQPDSEQTDARPSEQVDDRGRARQQRLQCGMHPDHLQAGAADIEEVVAAPDVSGIQQP